MNKKMLIENACTIAAGIISNGWNLFPEDEERNKKVINQVARQAVDMALEIERKVTEQAKQG